MRKLILVTVLFMSLSGFGQNQAEFPINYFDAPLDIPLYLAGNFGEIRSNHFHAGIDLKTQQIEGLKVNAAAKGYVSRIKVSLYGYGKAIYIAHPNGYTTVYAHLKSFNEEIEKYIRQRQYNQKSFEVDVYPKPSELKIDRGEVIALSGNTGGSGGPHLHFEIRKTDNQVPVNPLLFNFDIKDNIHPIIKTVSIYPLNDTSLVNGKTEPLHIAVRGRNGKYHLPGPLNLTARGVIGFGVETIDKTNGSHNRCGAYSVSLIADSDTIYNHKMTAIPFALSRYINCHIDYEQTHKNKRRVQKSFIEPNNKLTIYNDVKINGKVFFSEYDHELTYTVDDAYGNNSQIQFSVKVDTSSPSVKKKHKGLEFLYYEDNIYESENAKIEIPAYSLYKNLYFQHKAEESRNGMYTAIHHIADLYTPLQDYIDVYLKTEDFPTGKGNKLYAVSLDENYEVMSPEGGGLTSGSWFHFKTRSLGPYTVMIDEEKPGIVNLSGSDRKIGKNETIKFKIEDEGSGINTFNGYVDGEWILMEYDRKTNEFWLQADEEKISPGKHELKVIVTDKVGNRNSLKTSFTFIP